MGKWALRLAEESAAPIAPVTAETAKRGHVSVLAVTPKGGGRELHAPPAAECRQADRLEALDLAAVAWTDSDVARFLDRRARLMRWGWSESDAEQLADRLVRRDREVDDRVCCADCGHYRPNRCGNHRRAGLNSAGVGRDLAAMLQRCPGFMDETLQRNTRMCAEVDPSLEPMTFRHRYGHTT